jgi:hypothetical protein
MVTNLSIRHVEPCLLSRSSCDLHAYRNHDKPDFPNQIHYLEVASIPIFKSTVEVDRCPLVGGGGRGARDDPPGATPRRRTLPNVGECDPLCNHARF